MYRTSISKKFVEQTSLLNAGLYCDQTTECEPRLYTSHTTKMPSKPEPPALGDYLRRWPCRSYHWSASGQTNIRVGLIEQERRLDEQSRATHYTTAAIYGHRRAGVLTGVRAEGFSPLRRISDSMNPPRTLTRHGGTFLPHHKQITDRVSLTVIEGPCSHYLHALD